MVHLTPAAVQEINRLRSKQPHPDSAYCRLGVSPGICADWVFAIDFETRLESTDRLFEFDPIQLVIEDAALEQLIDVRIDYSEDLMGGAFRFNHPRAIATCQCGLAFSLAPLGVQTEQTN